MAVPTVAIVILNWNGRSYLERFLPFILPTLSENEHLWVADNASSDGSVDFLSEHFPSVHILQNPENEGFAKGYNTALKQISADYYVLLNSDVEVTPNWIQTVIQLMESDLKIAAVQPKILQYTNRNQFEYAGAAGGWIDAFGYPFCRGRVFDYCETDHGQYDEPVPVFWASGAAMFVRSSAFHEAGGFDPFFFAHQEEIDLCWRLQRMGYTIFVCPQSVVYHVGGGTLPKGNAKKVYLNFRNNLIMLSRNLPLSEKLWVIPIRFLLDAISAWKNLLQGETSYFFAVAKAHFHFFKWSLTKHQRYSIAKHSVARLKGYFSGSVVWQHFGKGQKKFREIVRQER